MSSEERDAARAPQLLNVGYGKLVDATQGRRTRSILVTDSDHVILSAVNPETVAGRLRSGEADDGEA